MSLKQMLSRATVFTLVALVFAQGNFPTVSLQRDDTNIVITNFDPSLEAVSRQNNRFCFEGKRLDAFYGPNEGFVVTVTDETTLTSAAVFIERPDDEGDESETLELFGGTIEFAERRDERPYCPEEIERSEDPKSVKLEQGRTTIFGTRFFLDRGADIGTMDGPVELDRVAEGDSPALSARAKSLDFNTTTDDILLSGEVILESKDRTSEAESVEFDDANSIAILRGSPATSRDSDGFVQGNTIVYYLDNNDVVVKGNLGGELNVDLGDEEATPSETVDPAGDPNGNDF